MTGIIYKVVKGKFCFLQAPNGQQFFAHRNDFLNPTQMEMGKALEFDPSQRRPGERNHQALNLRPANGVTTT